MVEKIKGILCSLPLEIFRIYDIINTSKITGGLNKWNIWKSDRNPTTPTTVITTTTTLHVKTKESNLYAKR